MTDTCPTTPPRQVMANSSVSTFTSVTPKKQLMAPHHRLAPGTPPGESMIPVSNYWKTPSVYGTPSSSFCIVPGSCQRPSTPRCNWTEGVGGELDTTHCATAAQDPSTRTQVAIEMVHGAESNAQIHLLFQSPPHPHDGDSVCSTDETPPPPPTFCTGFVSITQLPGCSVFSNAQSSHGTSIVMDVD